MRKTIIHFEDHGQDFLQWTIDETGKVVNCWPFQASIWCQYYVIDVALLKIGDLVPIIKDKEQITIKYPIEKIEVSDAVFSDCKKYRYALIREWDRNLPGIMFIGLNPSTADDTQNDPTINNVIKLAKHNGYGSIYMLNLFGIISSKPEVLRSHPDPVGEQDFYFDIYRPYCDKVLFAWGAFKEAKERAKIVSQRFPAPLCIGINNGGSPKHPLFQKSTLKFTPYNK